MAGGRKRDRGAEGEGERKKGCAAEESVYLSKEYIKKKPKQKLK